jgi:ketosteroid isomerase-like protein
VGTNVEIVRQVFAAFERRDAGALVALCDEKCLFEPVTAQIAGGDGYRGHEGMRRYLSDVATVWQELRPEPTTFHEVGADTVVATGRIYAWGVGRVIDSPAGWLWRLRDGRIVYGRVFDTARGALREAGLGAA